ncbi:MAG: family 16 glycoside hydrolase [Thermoguttaceae bacterium]|jgi:hypothetical protein
MQSIRFGLLLVWLTTAVSSAQASDGWTTLFDGKTLSGWKASESADSFRVENGAIVVHGPRSHLFYVGNGAGADFQNFELRAMVMTAPGANSGFYFHTEFQPTGFPKKGFEVQLNNSYVAQGKFRELKKTGSLYGIRNQYKAIVPDNEWFPLDIVVTGKRARVSACGVLLIDYVEPVLPSAGPNDTQRRLSHGTFALQCHDPNSKVFIKDIEVRRLAADASGTVSEPAVADDRDRQIAKLQRGSVPVVDLHVHLKGGLTLEQALANSRKTGINYGIAVNCGVGFPITSDAGIRPFLDSMQGQPVFIGMQAEGREWVKLFSREAIKQFDYVFTDAMTFTDDKGKRTRLWIKDEVSINDPQAFMEMYVRRIVGILNDEPINIYVNATFLPDCIASRYDELWTPQRMQKVIDAAAKNRIAVEINARYRIPSAAFIKRAKQAGVKFTFGTNNVDANLGRLEYCLDMVDECGLTGNDMYLPEPRPRTP